MLELICSVLGQWQLFKYAFITTKRDFSFVLEKLQKASGIPRSQVYASFISCQHLDKPSLWGKCYILSRNTQFVPLSSFEPFNVQFIWIKTPKALPFVFGFWMTYFNPFNAKPSLNTCYEQQSIAPPIFEFLQNKRGRGIVFPSLLPKKTTVKISALCFPHPHVSLTYQSIVQW